MYIKAKKIQRVKLYSIIQAVVNLNDNQYKASTLC